MLAHYGIKSTLSSIMASNNNLMYTLSVLSMITSFHRMYTTTLYVVVNCHITCTYMCFLWFYSFSPYCTLQPPSDSCWFLNSYNCVDSPTPKRKQPPEPYSILPTCSEWTAIQFTHCVDKCDNKHSHFYWTARV